MRPLPLTAETQAVLTRIRSYDWTLIVFGMSPSRAWRLVSARVQRSINLAGVALQEVNLYERYVHELVKAFRCVACQFSGRTETGEPLGRALLLIVRKWANFGLNPGLLQTLLCQCFLRFEQQGYAMPAVKPLTRGNKPGPKPRRLPRRTYEKALRKGRVSL